MKGKYTVKVSNNKVAYTLELERNITILTGESGIGKTALARLIRNYEDAHEQSGVTVKCKVDCRSISSDDGWEDRLSKIHNSIIFIDEGRRFLKTYEFAQAISGSDNYFVLITRESLPQIPYSVNSVLTLKNTSRRGTKQYSKTYERFDYLNQFATVVERADYIITEDSNAGHDAFTKLAEGNACKCISAGGKANIAGMLTAYNQSKIIIVADGAAFGAEMNDVYSYYQERADDVALYLPESFEWLVLKSGIVNHKSLLRILKNPSRYIYSEKHKSWELYFYDLLKQLTANTVLAYNKNKLNEAYVTPENMNKLRKAIEKFTETDK